MNKHDLRWLAGELYIWGDWRRQEIGLGTPSVTAEARLTCSPGRSTKPNRCPHYWPNPRARRVEDAMRQIEPHYQILLWLRYVQEATERRMREYCMVDKRGKARWQVEKAHKALLGKM